MTVCRECKFWNPIEGKEGEGDCFGHRVPGNTPTENCPTNSFQPRN